MLSRGGHEYWRSSKSADLAISSKRKYLEIVQKLDELLKALHSRGHVGLEIVRGPSFIFTGTGRAGSTWFFEILQEHPEVFLPANKGTFFFTRWYDRGVDWYEAFFPIRHNGKVVGEVCEDYLCSGEALARIKAHWPDMRLICCLRNPYERALSAWHFFRRNGLALPTLAAQGECRPEVFYMGHYASQLKVVRSLFPEDQLLIFLFDELKSAPENVVVRLYRFIGVDPQFVPPSLHSRINANDEPRSRLLARIVHDLHMHSWGRSRIASNLIGTVKHIRPLRRLIKNVLYKRQSQYDQWTKHIAEFPVEVIARYEHEISDLEKMLGRDLAHWHAPSHLIPEQVKRTG